MFWFFTFRFFLDEFLIQHILNTIITQTRQYCIAYTVIINFLSKSQHKYSISSTWTKSWTSNIDFLFVRQSTRLKIALKNLIECIINICFVCAKFMINRCKLNLVCQRWLIARKWTYVKHVLRVSINVHSDSKSDKSWRIKWKIHEVSIITYVEHTQNFK